MPHTGAHNGLTHIKSLIKIAGELFEVMRFRFDHADKLFAMRKFSGRVEVVVAEGHAATLKIILMGGFYKMGHVHRTHGVNLDWT